MFERGWLRAFWVLCGMEVMAAPGRCLCSSSLLRGPWWWENCHWRLEGTWVMRECGHRAGLASCCTGIGFVG
jgi:hypothetical protein